jgi:hypothetical protein
MMIPRLAPTLSTRLPALTLTAVVAAALAACGCGSKPAAGPSEPTEPTGHGGGPTGDDVGTLDLAKLGSPCDETDRCAGGGECVTYYGIAGPNGPAFKSCEITCASGKGCPAGSSCITIADGPGAVCRPAEPNEEQPIR